jgi:large subunit ribosomal protein L1
MHHFSFSSLKMAKHGKKYQAAAEKIQKDKKYSLPEAVKMVKSTTITSFDSTIEIHVTTGANVKHADQVVRATTVLPSGTGKSLRIAVFCDEDEAESAKKAGADVVGGKDLIEKVEKGEIDFDVVISTPKMMKSLAKVARILGPKGLMPSPKSGTVTPNIAEAISELKKGKIEFRTDKNGIIHSSLGKASFSEQDLLKNLQTFLAAVIENKPAGIKSTYIKNITLTSSMGPGVPVDVTTITEKS